MFIERVRDFAITYGNKAMEFKKKLTEPKDEYVAGSSSSSGFLNAGSTGSIGAVKDEITEKKKMFDDYKKEIESYGDFEDRKLRSYINAILDANPTPSGERDESLLYRLLSSRASTENLALIEKHLSDKNATIEFDPENVLKSQILRKGDKKYSLGDFREINIQAEKDIDNDLHTYIGIEWDLKKDDRVMNDDLLRTISPDMLLTSSPVSRDQFILNGLDGCANNTEAISAFKCLIKNENSRSTSRGLTYQEILKACEDTVTGREKFKKFMETREKSLDLSTESGAQEKKLMDGIRSNKRFLTNSYEGWLFAYLAEHTSSSEVFKAYADQFSDKTLKYQDLPIDKVSGEIRSYEKKSAYRKEVLTSQKKLIESVKDEKERERYLSLHVKIEMLEKNVFSCPGIINLIEAGGNRLSADILKGYGKLLDKKNLVHNFENTMAVLKRSEEIEELAKKLVEESPNRIGDKAEREKFRMLARAVSSRLKSVEDINCHDTFLTDTLRHYCYSAESVEPFKDLVLLPKNKVSVNELPGKIREFEALQPEIKKFCVQIPPEKRNLFRWVTNDISKLYEKFLNGPLSGGKITKSEVQRITEKDAKAAFGPGIYVADNPKSSASFGSSLEKITISGNATYLDVTSDEFNGFLREKNVDKDVKSMFTNFFLHDIDVIFYDEGNKWLCIKNPEVIEKIR